LLTKLTLFYLYIKKLNLTIFYLKKYFLKKKPTKKENSY